MTGKEIMNERTSRGMTRERLAELTGLSAMTIYRVETERVKPNRSTLMLIKGALAAG